MLNQLKSILYNLAFEIFESELNKNKRLSEGDVFGDENIFSDIHPEKLPYNDDYHEIFIAFKAIKEESLEKHEVEFILEFNSDFLSTYFLYEFLTNLLNFNQHKRIINDIATSRINSIRLKNHGLDKIIINDSLFLDEREARALFIYLTKNKLLYEIAVFIFVKNDYFYKPYDTTEYSYIRDINNELNKHVEWREFLDILEKIKPIKNDVNPFSDEGSDLLRFIIKKAFKKHNKPIDFLPEKTPTQPANKCDKESIKQFLFDSVAETNNRLKESLSEKEANNEILSLLNTSITEIVLDRRKRVEELRKSRLPGKAPLLWTKRDKNRFNNELEFLYEIYGEYINLGILFIDDLKNFDPTLYGNLRKLLANQGEGIQVKDLLPSSSSIDEDLKIIHHLLETNQERAKQVACSLCQKLRRSST